MKTAASLIDAVGLAKIVAEKNLAFSSIDELCDIADEFDVWSPTLKKQGLRLYKKTILRGVMRRNIKDEHGNKIEWVSIQQVDQGTGRKRRVYKQLRLFDVSDYEQTIRDRQTRVDVAVQEFRRFCRLAYKIYGDEIQGRFDFDLNGDEGNDENDD